MEAKIGYAQDLPPPGGYKSFDYTRKLPKPSWRWQTKLGVIGTFFAANWCIWYYVKGMWKMRKIEMADCRHAIEPILLAEQMRHTMRHWRKNRDYENELMKDVPGWVTGTYFGEPVYYNVRGRYLAPSLTEYYAHNSIKTKYHHTNYFRNY